MTPSRREFTMPERDREFLEASGLNWETVQDGNSRWLILHGFPIPGPYNVRETILALLIDPRYPDAQIDMVYFRDHLCLPGKSIPNLTDASITGGTWQRWSRHRTEIHRWVAGEDCVETHLHLVRDWLEREVGR